MKANEVTIKNKLEEGKSFKISRFKEKIKRTKPHKHGDYFEIIFLSEGEGFHWIETERYRLNAPEIYFLKPGSLHCWQFTSIPRGYVLLFNLEYIDAIKEANIVDLISTLEDHVRVSLPHDHKMDPIFENIQQEHSVSHIYSEKIIHGYLQALLAKILQLLQIMVKQEVPNSSLHERFLKLLMQHCPTLNLVNQYAELLHTSPQNLSANCRKYTGKTAAQHIAGHQLLEAKRHLLHTEQTVREVAYTLNFKDPSYFIRFFKKSTGQTPVQFRSKYFQ